MNIAGLQGDETIGKPIMRSNNYKEYKRKVKSLEKWPFSTQSLFNSENFTQRFYYLL